MSTKNIFNTTADLNRSDVHRTLSLNFVNNNKLSPLITFTRNSQATYFDKNGILQTAGINQPVFEWDPVTGQCLGLRVWDAVTNLFLRSEEFDVGSNPWLRSNLLAFSSGSIANAIAAPNGQITADFICEDTSTNLHRVSQTVTAVSGTTYTVSVFAKSSNRHLCINANSALNARAAFNLSTGAITVGIGSAAIQALPNGWYRCSVTGTAPSSAAVGIFLQINSSPTVQDNNYTGDGSSGLYLWGAQLNTGVLAPYVPTGAPTASSTADVASITGAAFAGIWNPSEATLFADFTTASTKANQTISIDDGTASNRIEIRPVGSNADVIRNEIVVAGSAQSRTITIGSQSRRTAVLAMRANDFRIQSGSVGLDNTVSAMPVVDRIRLNYATFANGELQGYIRELAIFNKRLPNSVLQSMT